MNRKKAEKKIRKKLTELKPCPFCGKIPEIEYMCSDKYSIHGSWKHYVKRQPCCPVMGLGKSDVFFTNNFKKPNYKLWWYMVCNSVYEWNNRYEER